MVAIQKFWWLEKQRKGIIGTEVLPEDVPTGVGARFYPWTIDNKYYSAAIHLCVVTSRFLVTAEIAESVQAFLVYFDSTTVSGLDSVSCWLPLLEEWLPEVMILVCERVSETGVSRQKAQEWCIQHGFELVELNPEEQPDEDGIIGTEVLPEDVPTGVGARFYPWTIDNKYYSAAIHLCVVTSRFLVTAEIAESVQAFLVYFDSTTVSGLDSVSCWLPLLEEWLPEVMILVCERVSETGVSRQKAQEWCIQHGFELVELNPEEQPDEDDDFPESTGVKRIIQALNANVWSNVIMKNDGNLGFGFLPALVGANHSAGSEEDEAPEPHPSPGQRAQSNAATAEAEPEANGFRANPITDPMLDTDIQELASLTAGDGDLENFERLFSKLKEMKEKAATLPHEQRKLHAEKVAKGFWMAIGGDRDEIEGLSSDEDN